MRRIMKAIVWPFRQWVEHPAFWLGGLFLLMFALIKSLHWMGLLP